MTEAASVASLPMYGVHRPDVERFWEGLAAALRSEGVAGVPDRLASPADLAAHWRDPALILSQTCGYPLVQGLDAAVTVLGAFRFDVPGATGTDYSSLVIVRDEERAEALAELRGRIAAFNSADSQSGTNALRALVAPLARDGRFFGGTIETGAHRHSIDRVREGEADVAAIDCVSFALIARHDPAAVAGLRVLTRTASAAGLPLITARRQGAETVERLRRGLERAVADPDLAEARAALFISGFARLTRADYAGIAAMRDAAIAAGYPELA